MPAYNYETFLRSAFGLNFGTILDQHGDPAGIAFAAHFTTENMASVKVGVGYAMEIFSNHIIANSQNLNDDEQLRIEKFTDDVINSSSLAEIADLITDYRDNVIETYFDIDDGKMQIKPNWALHEAAYIGNIDIVQSLISQGYDIEAKNSKGLTALGCAAVNGQTKTAKWLIDNGADMEAMDIGSYTALGCAAVKGQTEIAKLLIDNGADIEARDEGGLTPLIYAATAGSTETTELLISSGANIDMKDNGGWTALMYAVQAVQTKTAKLLIEKGANTGLKSDNGHTALSLAEKKGMPEIVEMLKKGQ